MRKVGVTQLLAECRGRTKLYCLLFPCIWWASRVRLFPWFKSRWLRIQCVVLIKNIIRSPRYNKCSANGPRKEKSSAFFGNDFFFSSLHGIKLKVFVSSYRRSLTFCFDTLETCSCCNLLMVNKISASLIQATYLIFVPLKPSHQSYY